MQACSFYRFVMKVKGKFVTLHHNFFLEHSTLKWSTDTKLSMILSFEYVHTLFLTSFLESENLVSFVVRALTLQQH